MNNRVLKSSFSNMISRTHAIIEKVLLRKETAWKVTDKSQNGVLVNNIVIQICIFNNKDVITFGGKGSRGVGAEVKDPQSDLIYTFIENPLWDQSQFPSSPPSPTQKIECNNNNDDDDDCKIKQPSHHLPHRHLSLSLSSSPIISLASPSSHLFHSLFENSEKISIIIIIIIIKRETRKWSEVGFIIMNLDIG